jgi:DNA polymerase-4
MRKIIHVDSDCFYAAVEMLDNPKLRGVPLAVGGQARSRGVIATCNYEARASGVRSAMASAHAQRLCPSLLIVPPRFERYREVSRQVQTIFQRHTSVIEPLSLDEAYLDVSGSDRLGGSATRIAETIRAEVQREVGITVSAGVAPNKFLAKIASEWRKPDGLFTVPPDAVDDFVKKLAVARLHGVGQVTAARLHNLGIYTCEDLRLADPQLLHRHLGSLALWLTGLANGHDERPVQTHHQRKSVSVEHTFSRDLPSLEACRLTMPGLLAQLQQRLSPGRRTLVKTAVLKLKFADFTQTTRECSSRSPDAGVFGKLLEEAFERGQGGVRLIGVGVRLANGLANGLTEGPEEGFLDELTVGPANLIAKASAGYHQNESASTRATGWIQMALPLATSAPLAA